MKVPIEVEDERDDERHEAAEASEAEAGEQAPEGADGAEAAELDPEEERARVEAAIRAGEEAAAFFAKWAPTAEQAGPRRGAGRFLRYWENKDRALAQPERPVVSGG